MLSAHHNWLKNLSCKEVDVCFFEGFSFEISAVQTLFACLKADCKPIIKGRKEAF
jgi:hypothetical protein